MTEGQALENVKLLAVRAKRTGWKAEYTDAVLRYCQEAGHGPNPLRAAPTPSPQTGTDPETR